MTVVRFLQYTSIATITLASTLALPPGLRLHALERVRVRVPEEDGRPPGLALRVRDAVLVQGLLERWNVFDALGFGEMGSRKTGDGSAGPSSSTKGAKASREREREIERGGGRCASPSRRSSAARSAMSSLRVTHPCRSACPSHRGRACRSSPWGPGWAAPSGGSSPARSKAKRPGTEVCRQASPG